MRTRTRWTISAIVLLTGLAFLAALSTGAEGSPTVDGVASPNEYDLMVAYDNGRYEVYWTFEGNEMYMAIRAQTTGWVAIGFDPSDRMKDADMVYGWVTAQGAVLLDLYATGVNGPHPEDTTLGGTYDLTEAMGMEGTGWTTLEFRRDLSTGDTYDNVIPTTGTIPIIWAVGPVDDFTTQHLRRGGAMWPNAADISLKSAPDMVFTGEQVDLEWWVNLTVWSSTDVTQTGVHWDTMSHTGVPDTSDYPNASAMLPGEVDGEYTVFIVAPEDPGTIYIIIHAVVDGNDLYAPMFYSIQVVSPPELVLVSSPDDVMEGSMVMIEWLVANAATTSISHTAVHWDTISHSGSMDFQAYANTALGTEGTMEGEYNTDLTAPEGPVTIYFILHAIVDGEHFYAPMEYMLDVYGMPDITLDLAPETALVDDVVVIRWTVTSPAPEDVTHTAVHWDVTSQGEPLIFTNYANTMLGSMGSMAGEYFANVTMPSTPGKVFFVVHAIVMDMDYYAMMEYEIDVMDLPVIDEVMFMDTVFTEGSIMVMWNISGAALVDVTHAAVHWDTVSHDAPLDIANYPNTETAMDGGSDSDYKAMWNAPGSAGTLYFIVHVTVSGMDIYREMEFQVMVIDTPMIGLVNPPQKVFAGDDLQIMWDIMHVESLEVAHTAVHWDLSSQGTPLDFQAYTNTEMAMNGEPHAAYMVALTAPTSAGSIFFVVHAIVMEEHFYADMEYEVMVIMRPTITLVDAPEFVYIEGNVGIWWDIDGVDMADVEHAAVHWDITSYGMPLDFTAYANTVMAMDGSPDSDRKAMITALSTPDTVYFVIHAIVLGENFYAEMEYSIEVTFVPTIDDIDFGVKVEGGDKVTVTFSIPDIDISRISHIGLHWDTESQGTPLDFGNYANSETIDPNAEGTYTITFKVPDKDGTVFFVIHSVIDGENVYHGNVESSFKVEKADESPGFGNGMALLAVAVIAIFATGILRRR